MKDYYKCTYCGQFGPNAPPHFWNEPCPHRLKVDEAYIQMLDAQRMSYIRSAGGLDSVIGMINKTMSLTEPEDDDEVS